VVTGHWVEETEPGVWGIKSALLGFTQMNMVHNGEWLRQALFKIIDHVGIAHKVWLILFLLFVHANLH